MSSNRIRLRSAACLLLLACGTTLASPAFTRRQDASGAGTSGDAPSVVLDPVVPPDVDSGSLQVLIPKKAIKLFFQSSAASRKRDGAAIAAQVDFNFVYPAVNLDYSDFVGGIVCTANTVKTTFASGTGYQQAVKSWPTKSKFLLITSTQGCGSDDIQNGYFVATSAAFDSASSTVTVQGAFENIQDIYGDMTLVWGHANTTDTSSQRLKPRDDCPEDWCGSLPFDFNLSPEIAAGLFKGKSQEEAEASAAEEDEHEAPWENAFLLWSSSDGEDGDTSGTKRSVIPYDERSLEARKVEKGFNLYCVDCGIKGEFTLGGVVSYCALSCITNPRITKAQVYVQGNMEAGIYLGLEAFAEYTKEWKKQLVQVSLLGWQIAGVVSIGPYIELDIKATFGIKAQGTLLVGGGAKWGDFGATLDFLDENNYDQHGFSPELVQKFEAKGELSMEATLGLPLSFGLGIDVHNGLWQAHAALVDTPQLKAEASISVSYINNNKYSTVTSQTIADDNNGLDLNDDCYGVKYEIGFENSVDFEAKIDGIGEYNYNINKWDYTFAEGCLGYQKPACEDSVKASPIIGDGVQCNVPVDSIDVGDNDFEVGKSQTVENEQFCAGLCMTLKKCTSFSWGADASECQLYNTDVESLSGLGTDGSTLVLFDKNCWQTKDCPYNATDPDPPSRMRNRRMEGMFDARSGVYLRPALS